MYRCVHKYIVMNREEGLLLLPHLAIGLVSWTATVLSMNRFLGCVRTTREGWYALFVFMTRAFVLWFAALGTINMSFYYQLTCSLIGNAMYWYAFNIIYNDNLFYVTFQQLQSLGLTLFLSFLWEVNSRMIVEIKGDKVACPVSNGTRLFTSPP